jgi:flagellar biosynthesis component FlhA
LLTPDLVEYYLTRIKSHQPALVNVVRHYFSIEELAQTLRRRLRSQLSIKNLPRVLEELIGTASDFIDSQMIDL